jgi:hypothetical protein
MRFIRRAYRFQIAARGELSEAISVAAARFVPQIDALSVHGPSGPALLYPAIVGESRGSVKKWGFGQVMTDA